MSFQQIVVTPAARDGAKLTFLVECLEDTPVNKPVPE